MLRASTSCACPSFSTPTLLLSSSHSMFKQAGNAASLLTWQSMLLCYEQYHVHSHVGNADGLLHTYQELYMRISGLIQFGFFITKVRSSSGKSANGQTISANRRSNLATGLGANHSFPDSRRLCLYPHRHQWDRIRAQSGTMVVFRGGSRLPM